MLLVNQLHGFGAATAAPSVWTTTWSDTGYDSNQVGIEGFSFRVVIPAASISTSGTTIRVSLIGNTGATLSLDNVSIVERSGSTADGTTTPTSLLFSGAASVSITAGNTAVSDSTSFTLDETKDYLVIFDVSGSNGNMRYRSAGGTSYFKAAADSYNSTTVSGFSTTTLYDVTKIEVLV